MVVGESKVGAASEKVPDSQQHVPYDDWRSVDWLSSRCSPPLALRVSSQPTQPGTIPKATTSREEWVELFDRRHDAPLDGGVNSELPRTRRVLSH